VIGLVATSFPRFPGDYAGSFVGDRVDELRAAGEDVEVLAAGPGAAELCTEHGAVRVTRIDAGGLFYGAGAPETLERGGAAAWMQAARFTVMLARAIATRRERWDAVECHWLVPCALAAASSAPALPCRAFAHSGDVALLERIPFGHAIARLLAAAANADISFVSADLQARFARLVGRSVGRVAPLSVSAARFAHRGGRQAAARRALGLERATVLAVGRLVPIKGHARLLRAVARLPAPHRPEVVILGDGPERPSLERLAVALDVPLCLPGFVSRDAVAMWLAAADVFVQPSIVLANGRSEGAPVALLEARAVGVPVVVGADPAGLARAIAESLEGNHAVTGA
jgi:glycosyltransferase involved in cell wall biosynthesis